MSTDIIAYNTETQEFWTAWKPSKTENLAFHNMAWDYREMGIKMERDRILALFDLEADNMPVNHIIHMILKDVTK
jgi:hypothetical protein